MKKQPLCNSAIETTIIASFVSIDHEGTQTLLWQVVAKQVPAYTNRRELDRFTEPLPARQGGSKTFHKVHLLIAKTAFEAAS